MALALHYPEAFSPLSPGLLKESFMVCNVDHFQWPFDEVQSNTQFDAQLRPLPEPPHADTPYVVVLLKILSVTDQQPDQDFFQR